MIQELEEERQRRNKAEMAAGRLVEHVRSLQAQLEESTRGRELAVARTAKLDAELKKERERTASLEGEIQKGQGLLEVARSEVEVVRGKVREQEATVRGLEEEGKKKTDSHAAERNELVSCQLYQRRSLERCDCLVLSSWVVYVKQSWRLQGTSERQR